MSSAEASLSEPQPPKARGFKRFYRLFRRPSSADVRHSDTKADKKTKKIITGLTQVAAPEKERFIPVSHQSLVAQLNAPDLWAPGEEQLGQSFMADLHAWRHQTYRERLNILKDSYLPFSPDSDTQTEENSSEADVQQNRGIFLENVADLLESANYERINQENLDLLLTSDSPYGLSLHVDLDAFDDVVLYFRGAGNKIIEHRDWKWAFLKTKSVETPIFQRLFVALKLKPQEQQVTELMVKEKLTKAKAEKRVKKSLKLLPDGVTSDHIYLKLFKNIPQDDLEMMFPNTKVEFKLLDKLKLGLTAGGGTVAGLVGIVPKLFAAATLLNPITLITTLVGFIGLLVRQITKFFNQRNEYMMTLAQNLYFHNLANNRGVLTLLVDRAEEEDIKEEILLYAFLCRIPNQPTNLTTAKTEIESFLQTHFNVTIEFDVKDAFSRLLRDGLVEKKPDGSYKILPPAEATKQIHCLWRGALHPTGQTTSEEA